MPIFHGSKQPLLETKADYRISGKVWIQPRFSPTLPLHAHSNFHQPLSEKNSLMGMRFWAQDPNSLWGVLKRKVRSSPHLPWNPRVLSSFHPRERASRAIPFVGWAFLNSFLLQRILAGMSSPQTARIGLQNFLGSSKFLAVQVAPGYFAGPQALDSG